MIYLESDKRNNRSNSAVSEFSIPALHMRIAMGMTIWTGAFVFSPRPMRLSSVNTPFGPILWTAIAARPPLPDEHTVSQVRLNVNKYLKMCMLRGLLKWTLKLDVSNVTFSHILNMKSHIFENYPFM